MRYNKEATYQKAQTEFEKKDLPARCLSVYQQK
jgi:hypothetical protein